MFQNMMTLACLKCLPAPLLEDMRNRAWTIESFLDLHCPTIQIFVPCPDRGDIVKASSHHCFVGTPSISFNQGLRCILVDINHGIPSPLISKHPSETHGSVTLHIP